MNRFVFIISSILSINLIALAPTESPVKIENIEKEESLALRQLSNWVTQLQKGLYETAGINTIAIGGGSARAILDHLYEGKPLEMRDLDIFAIAEKEVTPDWLDAIGRHLETKEFGYFSKNDLRSRPRTPSNKPVLVRNDYVAGYGLHWIRDNGEILDLSVFHTKDDLDLNGIFDIDTTMILLDHTFSILDFADKVKELDYDQLKNDGFLYDRYNGYVHWQEGKLNIVNWLDIESDPLVKIMRALRTVFKNNENSLSESEEENFIYLIKEAKVQNPLQMTRGLLKILGDKNAEQELSVLQKLGLFEKWLPEFNKLVFSEIDFSEVKELDYGRDDRLALARLYHLIQQPLTLNERLTAIFNSLYHFDPYTAVSWIHEALTGELFNVENIEDVSEKRLYKIAKSTILSSKEKEALLKKELQGEWQPRKGVISGVFNPVHRGHVELFQEAIDEMVLDELIIVPNEGELGYEAPILLEHRWKMLKLIEDQIDELHIISQNHLPIQATDINGLISTFIQEEPETYWTRIIGSDSFEGYVNNGFLKNETANSILVIQRDREQFYPVDEEISAKIYYKSHQPTDHPHQKSHQSKNARKMARQGENPSSHVPDAVAEYIISHSLYQDKSPLHFITTNAEKQEKVREVIPEVKQVTINIPLTDWSNPKSAVQHKLKEAKKAGVYPVIVMEEFIQIAAISHDRYLPISDQTLSILGNENLITLLKQNGDLTASLLSYVGYASDEHKTKLIEHRSEGVISLEILQREGATLKEAFVPANDNDDNQIEQFMENLKVKRLGFMTGVFNPIHLGHLDTLKAAKNFAELEKVIIIPTPATNHNEAPIAWEARHEMVELAAQNYEGFEPIPTHYKKWLDEGTNAALEQLKSDYPNAQFFHIMGSDSFERFQEKGLVNTLDDQNSVIVLQRKGHEISPNDNPHVSILDTKTVLTPEERASSVIRQHLQEGESISHLVPPEVEAYIQNHTSYYVDG